MNGYVTDLHKAQSQVEVLEAENVELRRENDLRIPPGLYESTQERADKLQAERSSLLGELATMLGPRQPRPGVTANDQWIAAVGEVLADRDKLQVELDEAKKQVQRERDWRHEAVGYERAKAATAREHAKESREREDGLRTQMASLADDFDRREREAKAEAADAPSEQVQHREEGISLAFGAAAGDLRSALTQGGEDTDKVKVCAEYVAHWNREPTPEEQAALGKIVEAAYEKLSGPRCPSCNHVHLSEKECGASIGPSSKCTCVALDESRKECEGLREKLEALRSGITRELSIAHDTLHVTAGPFRESTERRIDRLTTLLEQGSQRTSKPDIPVPTWFQDTWKGEAP